MNGMMYRKSRYRTFSAVSQREGPKLARKARAINKGRNTICQPGKKWYQMSIASRMTKLIRKSTNETMIMAVGTISRGKNTLLIRLALLIKLLDASAKPVAKNVQGSMPAKTINA